MSFKKNWKLLTGLVTATGVCLALGVCAIAGVFATNTTENNTKTLGDGTTIEETISTEDTDNVTLTVVTDFGNGSISTAYPVASGSTVTISGDTLTIDGQTITATPQSGYITNWSIANGATISVNTTITASFMQVYTVTIQACSWGSVNVKSVANVPSGSTVTVSDNTLTVAGQTITATPESGYQTTWSVSTGTTITSNTTITASFAFSGVITTGDVYYSWDDAITNGYVSVSNGYLSGGTNKTSIKRLGIPNSITYISGFNKCSNLTGSLIIPDSVKTISGYAFEYCSGLTSITIGSGLTSLGNFAFAGFSGLTIISVASGNTYYNDGNGSNCIIETSSNTLYLGCKNTTIPNTVTSLAGSAFYNCSSLTSITIPSSVTSIRGSPFKGTSFLAKLKATTKILTVLNDGNLSSSVIANQMFKIAGTAGYTYYMAYSDDDSKYICFGGSSDSSLGLGLSTAVTGSVDIPNGTTCICGNAFIRCTGLTSITIPSSVIGLGGYAFYECTGLKSITIPDKVTCIEGCTFDYCSGLTSITIGLGVTSIEIWAFSNCTSLTSITIGSGVTSIGQSAFGDCTSLTSITIPNSVTSIGRTAFEDCTSLTSITIPSSVTSIEYGAFEGCTSLTSVTIGSGVTSIGSMAFYGLSGLTTVTIDSATIAKGLTTYAYGNVINYATTIYIKDTISTIGSYVTSNYSSTTTDKSGYVKYVKNS